MPSFLDYQVLYTDTIPTGPIRLGQLLVDESEADPLDMPKVCTDLSPVTYVSLSDGIQADLLASNNIWTGTNEFDAATTFDGSVNFTGTFLVDGAAGTAGYVLTSAGAGNTPVWGEGGYPLALGYSGMF